jgi:hypothetical protein
MGALQDSSVPSPHDSLHSQQPKTVKTVMTLTWYRHFWRIGGLDKEVNKNVKNIFLSMCDVKVSLTFTSLNLVLLWQLFCLFCSSIVINTVIVTAGRHFCWLPYLYTFSLYENASFIIVSAETEYISTRSWYRNVNFLIDRIRRIF